MGYVRGWVKRNEPRRDEGHEGREEEGLQKYAQEQVKSLENQVMNLTSRTILIIDDCLQDRELYRRYLLRDQNYHIQPDLNLKIKNFF
ncbi:hypothetical protein MEO93_02520 [Dolichospermum sp. ST_sed3]|nr:hypothetical protein [Dolichospermum sp. ST_sed6]MDD1439261.1 hypothetical protein [Dolichospermum sp. ST_sed3]MDD1446130.1 hypothetical protein [Dolichospermum sp. ST_sed8]MDD1454026.1 hypothetical protein [Dolichospermum sp. ST_sed7]MDD1459945.1 hypothetical protein [Dolichospermum sp. ST_sed2]MDD1470760.1 hypothetical protein [Dolichospermum sp. ST_sed4]